ncbi:multicopper oxidase domain-containing protein [Bradyrhizobium jicamae]|uniref:multicopper oxidase domain-containing protein n=1 Tax=Bradyrhizobium jicamae TaxID=280332 RepID=UPI001FD986F9|nr:multicopper oxidase domain-containing protein [Bradyrhizobium jicamae]
MNRRELIAGLGAAALTPAWSATGMAQADPLLDLRIRPDRLAIRPGAPDTPVLSLGTANMRFNRGDKVELASDPNLENGMASLLGMDSGPATPQDPARPSKIERRTVLRQAGTFVCDLGLFPNERGWPTRAHPLIVQESEQVAVDRDETLLIEEWRIRADGKAVPPGAAPNEAEVFYTLNGKPSFDVSARSNERFRLRFINGSQRTVIAVKLESVAVWVMAIDSQPAEPFPARNGAVVLAPGSRVDAFVDVTAPAGSNLKIWLHEGKEIRTIGSVIVSPDPPARPTPLPPPPPLPSNGLPARLDLKNALRVDLALDGPDWSVPTSSGASSSPAPAFRVKAGRTVVVALTNRAATATVFRLHGHHFRLLDRLDDGWKPFWLDTLAIEPGQTQRIAFRAEYAGLIESVAADWAAPRRLRGYRVE